MRKELKVTDMFRVMLVEDEPPTMRMVKNAVESTDNDFKVVHSCIDGSEAIEILKKEDVELIITDIKMPVITGLELAEWVKENSPQTVVVILSGYQDFEFARKAMSSKVFDYLLKPVSKDNVRNMLSRVKKELSQRKGSTGKYDDESNTVVILSCAGPYLLYGSDALLPSESFWTDDILEGFMKENLRQDEEYIFFNTNMQSERFFVVQTDDAKRQEKIVKELYNKISGRKLPITLIYKTGVKLKDAGRCFGVLREKLIKRLILDKSQLVDANDDTKIVNIVSSHYKRSDIEAVTNAIRSGKQENIKKPVSKIIYAMKEAECTQEELTAFLNTVIDSYILDYPDKVERRNTSIKSEIILAIAGFVDYDKFIDDIVSILATLGVKEKTDRYSELADEIEEYLTENYNQNISTEVLSAKFGFVPSYISRIFKNKKGVSPSEYLIKYRIKMAKKLMKERPDIMIKEVAYIVGFKEAYYFSKTFKRETGMWPTEFAQTDN